VVIMDRQAENLLSVNVGLPQDVAWRGRVVHTAVWKRPVDGPQMVRRLNIDGDGQGNLAAHSGEHRAVFVYQIESYRYWQEQLGRNDFTCGQFEENFTVTGLADDQVCIGDRYRIGSAVFEVTQPRVTCHRVGIRMDDPRIPALLISHHRPGFYVRALTEGPVQAGDDIIKIASGPEGRRWRRSTPCCTCRGTPASRYGGHCGSRRCPPGGEPRSRRCSARAPRPATRA
jgi:MOSC domain-containing protein YiiM